MRKALLLVAIAGSCSESHAPPTRDKLLQRVLRGSASEEDVKQLNAMNAKLRAENVPQVAPGSEDPSSKAYEEAARRLFGPRDRALVESFREDVKRDPTLALAAQQAGFELPIPIDDASVDRLAPKVRKFLADRQPR